MREACAADNWDCANNVKMIASGRNWFNNSEPCGIQTGQNPPEFTQLPWIGVNCTFVGGNNTAANPGTAHLVSLDLMDYDLGGTLPASFMDLDFLAIVRLANNNISGSVAMGVKLGIAEMDLSYNQFSGTISVISENLVALEFLDISSNRFTGRPPTEESDPHNLIKLKYYNISNNFFTGGIDPNFFNSTVSLEALDLHNNSLRGPIIFDNITTTKLQKIDVSSNGFNGTVPETYALPALKYLSFSNNMFTGSLPAFPQALTATGLTTSLEFVDLSKNLLHGTIPNGYLSHIETLAFLILGNNSLSGQIPNYVGLIVPYLFLGNNNFTGTIPNFNSPLAGGRTHADELLVLDIQNNSITGPIPDYIWDMPKIIDLNFSSNALSGTLSPDIAKLNLTLEGLGIGKNNFTGSIPEAVYDLTKLRILNTSENYFIGTLSNSIGKLTNLEVLSMFNNDHSGSTIPTELYNLTKLEICLLGRLFHGTLPEAVGNLTNLIVLDISVNPSMGGSIPQSITRLTKLEALAFTNNSMTGSLPDNFWSLTKLKGLLLSANSISGNIAGIANLTRAEGIDLDQMQLSGTIPEGIGKLTNLILLALSKNNLHGTVPESFGQLTNLEYLDLAHSNLHGTLPQGVNNFTKLLYMDIDTNNFEGPAPYFWNYKKLQDLFLFENNFEGTLSEEIGELSDLRYLDIGGNLFHGPIPQSFSNLTQLQYIILTNNSLTGTVPFADIAKFESLQYFIIGENFFTGPVSTPYWNQVDLTIIDISYNAFTGTLPAELMAQNLALHTFVAAFNNFQGYLSSEICNATSLKHLLIPGLSATETNVRYIWPLFFRRKYHLNTFQVAYMKGQLPACVYQMPNIVQIVAGGNGFIGDLPEVALSPSLKSLDLSFNRISGTITSEMVKNLVYIDLSRNAINGDLSGFNDWKPQDTTNDHLVINKTISANLNRLSGTVPTSLTYIPQISILKGNVFSCTPNIRDIADHDAANYICGSQKYNYTVGISYGLFFGILIALGVFRWRVSNLFQKCHSLITRWHSDSKDIIKKYKTWAAVDDSNENPVEDIFISKLLEQEMESKGPPMTKMGALEYFENLIKHIRNFKYNILILGNVIWIPMIIIIPCMWRTFGSGIRFSYSWITTTVYLGGKDVMIAMSVMFILFLSIFYLLAYWFKYGKLEAVNLNTEDVKKRPKVQEKDKRLSVYIRSYLRLLIIIFADIVVISYANVLYTRVYDTKATGIQIFVTLCMSMFKIFWGMLGMKYILLRNDLLYFTMTESEADLALKLVFGSRTAFVVVLNIMNNIVVPLLVFGVESPTCFNDAVKTIWGEFSYTLNFCPHSAIIGQNVCLKKATIVNHRFYQKPFDYLFKCASNVIKAYSSVYLFKFIGEFVLYVGYIFIALYIEFEEEDPQDGIIGIELGLPPVITNTNITSSVQQNPSVLNDMSSKRIKERDESMSTVSSTSRRPDKETNFAKIWKEIVLFIRCQNMMVFYSKKVDLKALAERKFRKNFAPLLLNVEYFMASCVSMYAIVLTFGPVAPLVALMGTLCLMCKATVAQILLGRLLGHILHNEKNEKDSSHEHKNHSVGRQNSDGATRNPLEVLRVNNLLDEKKSGDAAITSSNDAEGGTTNEDPILDDRQLRTEFVLKMGEECKILQKNTIWENRFTLMLTASVWYGCCAFDIYGLGGTMIERIQVAVIVVAWPVLIECTRYIVHYSMIELEKRRIKEGEKKETSDDKPSKIEDGIEKDRGSTSYRSSMTRASRPSNIELLHGVADKNRTSVNPMHSSMDENSEL